MRDRDRRRRSARPSGSRSLDPRAAGGAGVGLRVEAAVERVAVLARAGRAHPEGRHGGGGPVVGRAERDGEARAAGGAVGEGVAVPAVGRVGHLAQAVRAGGEIRAGWPPAARRRRRSRRSRTTGPARPRWARRRASRSRAAGGRSARRRAWKASSAAAVPKASMVTPAASFRTRPVEAERVGEAVDEGAEADPLHRAGDGDAPALGGRGPPAIVRRLAHRDLLAPPGTGARDGVIPAIGDRRSQATPPRRAPTRGRDRGAASGARGRRRVRGAPRAPPRSRRAPPPARPARAGTRAHRGRDDAHQGHGGGGRPEELRVQERLAHARLVRAERHGRRAREQGGLVVGAQRARRAGRLHRVHQHRRLDARPAWW